MRSAGKTNISENAGDVVGDIGFRELLSIWTALGSVERFRLLEVARELEVTRSR